MSDCPFAESSCPEELIDLLATRSWQEVVRSDLIIGEALGRCVYIECLWCRDRAVIFIIKT